ncbi:Glucosidase 2 subunit beta [Phytophthora citrophthora]|uniref:Glucosidase 2 subunit beta n=1 Tax=Phytophthora citrophthora TaxID=4793 RepID=A0AAD9LNJ4_9STRA|nr:Glucosidase 2 subunit beta [Phytophthora citrophthora]
MMRLAAVLALLSVCVRATDYRGISPELQSKLSAVSSFTCDKGQQRLELSRLNDNYCDCEDGSDEPGTSACSHTDAVFHCVNAGFFSADVPTSQVNDGLCDCCDGSDEYASGVSCASECNEKMEAFRADKKDLIEQVDAGLKDRVALAAEAQKLWDEEEVKKMQIETTVTSKKVMVEQLEARKADEERLEQEEKIKRIGASKQEILSQLGLLDLTKEQLLSIILEIGRTGVSEKHELLPIIRKEREAAYEGEEELSNTPMEEKDEAFRERDDARQKETTRIEKLIEEREKEEERKAQEAKEALEKAAEAAAEGNEAEVAETELPAVIEEETPTEEEDLTLPEVETHPIDLLYEELAASERYEWVQAVMTRKLHEETKKELTEEEKKLSDAQKQLEKNYGDDHVFFALRDKCVDSEAGQYKYKICFFGKATQDHTKLGDMEDIKGPEPAESEGSSEDTPTSAEVETTVKELKFSNGQKCWNGPNRSLEVKLECGPEPMELRDIEEPSTCVYTAKLRTPAVCSEESREKILTFNDAKVAPHHIEIEVPATL